MYLFINSFSNNISIPNLFPFYILLLFEFLSFVIIIFVFLDTVFTITPPNISIYYSKSLFLNPENTILKSFIFDYIFYLLICYYYY